MLEQLPWSYFQTPGTAWCSTASTRIFQLGLGSLATCRSRRQVRSLSIFLNCLLSKLGALFVFLGFYNTNIHWWYLSTKIQNYNFPKVSVPSLNYKFMSYSEFSCLIILLSYIHSFAHSLIHQTFIKALLCPRFWGSKVTKVQFVEEN